MAVDVYLALPAASGIAGTAPALTYPDGTRVTGAIPLESFGIGLENTTTGQAGQAAGRAVYDDLTLTKNVDVTSPKLFEACAAGTVFKTATVLVADAGKVTLIYALTTALIRSVAPADSPDDDTAQESLTVAYASMAVTEPTTTGGTTPPPPPPPTLPDAPYAVALPLAAAAAGAAALAVARSRRESEDPDN